MIIIDFESKSSVDIECGARKYSSHPSTDVLLLAWMDTTAGPDVHQWMPGMELPDWCFREDERIYAFNVDFESEMWAHIMVARYGAPDIPMARWEDVQALCARYSLPRSLSAACAALRMPLSTVKLANGAKLIKMFCIPPFAGQMGSKEWDDFCEYNRRDVVATWEVLKRLPLPTLSASERAIFEMTWRINIRGLPVAVEEAARIYEVIQVYLAEHNALLPDITGGAVTKITQVSRIAKWLRSVGVDVQDLRRDTVEFLLETLSGDTPEERAATQVLELRAATGLSSFGKFKRIVDMSHDGRIHFNSQYYGAHTGRITGSGFQLLNLPRAKVADPESEIQDFITGDIMERNPVQSGRALVRSMIKAPEGKIFYCADYASIEYILLIWLTGDTQAVESFRRGQDPYKMLAMSMYGVRYEDVTSSQRQMGKIGVLGCGYGLGARGCVAYASQFGVTLSEDEAAGVVGDYRSTYRTIPPFWYDLSDAAMNAVRMRGSTFTVHRTSFQVMESKGREYLRVGLPSGRAMYYHEPRIDEGLYGPLVFVHGQNQTTKQWTDRQMTPGKWAENIIQAIGRDLLYFGKAALEKAGYEIIGSIYDEVIAEVPVGFKSLEDFCTTMASLPPWCEGLPLRADGWSGNRYKKD